MLSSTYVDIHILQNPRLNTPTRHVMKRQDTLAATVLTSGSSRLLRPWLRRVVSVVLSP